MTSLGGRGTSDRDHAVVELEPGDIRRRALHDVIDRRIRWDARTCLVELARRERHTEAAELALGVLPKMLVAGRWQERRVGVEVVQHAASGVVEQPLLVDGIDIVRLHGRQRLRERIEGLESRDITRHGARDDPGRDDGAGHERG